MLFNTEDLDLTQNERNINALHAYSIYGCTKLFHHKISSLNTHPGTQKQNFRKNKNVF